MRRCPESYLDIDNRKPNVTLEESLSKSRIFPEEALPSVQEASDENEFTPKKEGRESYFGKARSIDRVDSIETIINRQG